MHTHKELITAGTFDEKFKRALLNYYSYGFKNLKFFDAKKKQTLLGDWQRLNNVISDYLEWSEDRNKVMFANADSQSMETNPFHRIYRFCKYTPLTDPAYFLHTMAALSKSFKLRGGVYALNLDDNQNIHLEDVIEKQEEFKTSDLICFYTEKLVPISGDHRNKTPNNRLNDLSRLGLVACKQNKGAKGGIGDHRWSLPGFTMKKILDAGSQVSKNFELHLRSALDFFSKYYLFGEVGTFLLDRLRNDEVSPFRLKHEYFMQSLNDFNIIDLLYAIEQNKWCKIKYHHGIAGFETELLCYPLEIRISNMHGREYLMYYEPFKRSYTSLRIEFIDSIEFYDDIKVKSVLAQTGYHPLSETVDTEISNARESLKYSWGVSSTKEQEGNAKTVAEHHLVKFKIAYNPQKEYYIVNRLFRERRSGYVPKPDGSPYLQFSVNVSDETELHPWLRSFYSRIVACDGMETDTFSLDSDVQKIVKLLIRDELATPPQSVSDEPRPIWAIPDKVRAVLGNGTKAREHDLLFNEVFGVYYYIFADVFTRLSSGSENRSYSKAEINQIINDSFHKFYLLIGLETENLLPAEMMKMLLEGGFLKKTVRPIKGKYEIVKNEAGTGSIKREKTEDAYISKYCCEPDVEMYRDVVPLTTLEIRWLKTIIGDSKMNLFFSESEINLLQKLLAENAPSIKALPMQKVIFFDRFRISKKNSKREAAVLDTILQGIYNQKTLRIKYHTMKGEINYGEFKPIVLEFSKRNNRFQGFFQDCRNNDILVFNIARIETCAETETPFDYSAAEQAFADYRKKKMTSVEIEFYNVRNIVDRILTEFSPWKKRCSYDEETEKYTLTIFYQKQDEIDLVVRLLGYGANIRFTDKKHPIFIEIQSRMNEQMKLISERRKNGNVHESGDGR